MRFQNLKFLEPYDNFWGGCRAFTRAGLGAYFSGFGLLYSTVISTDQSTKRRNELIDARVRSGASSRRQNQLHHPSQHCKSEPRSFSSSSMHLLPFINEFNTSTVQLQRARRVVRNRLTQRESISAELPKLERG